MRCAAYVAAWDPWADTYEIMDARLAAVLAIVDHDRAAIERDHEIETSKLRGALKLAGDSRNRWKQRALDAGWTP